MNIDKSYELVKVRKFSPLGKGSHFLEENNRTFSSVQSTITLESFHHEKI